MTFFSFSAFILQSTRIKWLFFPLQRRGSPKKRNGELKSVFRLLMESEFHISEVIYISNLHLITNSDGWISMLARDNQLKNVVHYVDLKLIQDAQRDLSDHLLFENCIEFGLRRFFAHLVSLFESLEDLKKIIQQLNLEKMSGEATKTFAAKIFELTD